MQKKRGFFYENSLSIVLTVIFLLIISGQISAGWHYHNLQLLEEGEKILSLSEYLVSAHFVSATFENWESEFLQMGMYVILLIFLRQKGSAESKKLEGDEEVDREPKPSPEAPWAVRKGGWWQKGSPESKPVDASHSETGG